jgi:hypothetical protein
VQVDAGGGSDDTDAWEGDAQVLEENEKVQKREEKGSRGGFRAFDERDCLFSGSFLCTNVGCAIT